MTCDTEVYIIKLAAELAGVNTQMLPVTTVLPVLDATELRVLSRKRGLLILNVEGLKVLRHHV